MFIASFENNLKNTKLTKDYMYTWEIIIIM